MLGALILGKLDYSMELLQCDPGTSTATNATDNLSRPKAGRRRLLTIAIGVVVLAVAFVFFSNSESRPSGDSTLIARDPELTELTLDLSLLSQQLDELFQFFIQRVSDDATLAPEDRALLQNWLEFDERFIERIRDRNILKFERVNAHLRLGHGLYLLELAEPSIAHFETAIELLEDLLEENSMIASYRLDQSDAYYGLGRSKKVLGRNREALEAIETAIRILSDPRFPPATGRQERLAELYIQRRELLASNVNVE